MVDLKECMDKAAAEVGVKFKGLLFQKAHIKNGVGSLTKDILGWDYVYRTVEGVCYKFYRAEPPLIGMTLPVPVVCPLGIRVFDSYKVDFKEAIEIFHKQFHEKMFTAMILSWVLVPGCEEPFWHIKSITGEEIAIGANTSHFLKQE